MNSNKQLQRYDRQIHTFGLDAMQKISTSSVLISGMNGVGVEIAKNVILSGIHIVAVHDTCLTKIEDLSTQFYLTEADIGKNRAEQCVKKLAELNEYVQVELVTNALTEETISKYKVVVLCNASESEIQRISAICRKHEIKFMIADISGLFSRIFIDVGSEHNVTDQTGERVKMVAIEGVSNTNPAVVSVVDGEIHDFSDEDFVQFSLVEGMTEINDLPPAKVQFVSKTKFKVEIDATKFGEYVKNGYVTEVKMPTKVTHKPYEQQQKKPEIVYNGDMMHDKRSETIHSCFFALDEFRQKNGGRAPIPHSEKETEEFVKIASHKHEEIFGKEEEQEASNKVPFDKEIATLFGRVCAGSCAPVSSAVGGIVGQEVVKAVTNKLMPLTQWLYLDHSQCLDPEHLPTEADAAPRGCRYDGQIAIFGNEMQKKLGNLNYFLVGAGAIGCEALKNYALMGVACGEKGLITVTDMDNIEISNLSRQFLFRARDIGHPKSERAAVAVKLINPNIKIKALTEKVGLDTETTFNSEFWESLDGVANALDNVPSRLYVDGQCVNYRKSLLECGTLGTKGNTQTVVPYLTENYGASPDPPEKDIAMCTVKNLPYLIEHTIEFIRGMFVELFTEQPADAASYIRNPSAYLERLRINPSNRLFTIENLNKNLLAERPKCWKDCVVWGRMLFEQIFTNQIKQLLFNFPADATTTGGELFWSGHKRMPTPLTFDKANPMHIEFVASAAFIRAQNYSITVEGAGEGGEMDMKAVAEIAAGVVPPPFVPRQGISIDMDGQAGKSSAALSDGASSSTESSFDESKVGAMEVEPSSEEEMEQSLNKERESEEKVFQQMVNDLPSGSQLKAISVQSIEFEKDDDTNHHIDFITAGANLRAINYGIPTADRSRIKQISGKIIPAIATTTSLISGLTCFDLLSLARKEKSIDNYRNWFVNLAINIFTYSSPIRAAKLSADSAFTVWDKINLEYDHEPTLNEVIERVQNEKRWSVDMVCFGTGILFMQMAPEAKKKMRLSQKLSECIKDVINKVLEPGTSEVTLILTCSDMDDIEKDVEVPPIAVKFPATK
ncbi:putative Ubiquitin-like modifier-activating enzyme 1 A (Uba1A) [Monocercomonoides exilis]|uniref:putative Ubiquitin-like modifier-activating enzyme 1 A (Uba1A) n=1 Tax=Monocercomonoides exilis TaxID=2049356 RepID=UPI003559AF82|nr:putative Ubiquitin-like modifier-activating enzyme 1 A (Uba1A) [Monocercomonoides exilis]|eukprot:MONOS_2831.1-p1 / transcript=MONOS_2831.1 / gene=MONOS_2831 / organism=Monocercomonoides_exilis_PA203 / gene_product=Ubiquitin-like modifier-activating enzyme 1 A (Uba1A) / transcript_product=Ubiquitin-like modifier-activating enzyme 1 A (Uba1A) / location=Mono_scaffold00061:29657-33002(+) / protein_length=1068 / sequence_SO=supercontig / SO=protein_coding / is_pseudo=false